MAFQAGLINTGGFMACQRFVSHVTGFATFFGIDVGEAKYAQALGMLTVPFFFLYGSMISGHLVDIKIKQHKQPQYYMAFGLMFALILIVLVGGMYDFFGEFGETYGGTKDNVLLALLCLVCGIQNGTITSVSKSVVRTTHLTGITTDLGIGLVRLFSYKKLSEHLNDELNALKMRVGIILSFGLGSVIGTITFLRVGYLGFLVPAITTGSLFFVTYYFQVVHQKYRAKKLP